MNENLHLEVLDLRFNNLADLIDDTNETACSIDVNNKISEIDTLTFNIGVGNEKLMYLKNENLIKYENQIYKIHGLKDIRNSGVEHTVECEHISINLTKVNFGQTEIPLESSDVLCRKTLENTGWVFIGSDIPQDEKKHLVTGMEASVYEALTQLAETFDAVVEFGFREDDNKLTVFLRRGRYDRGLVFEHSFNLLGAEADSSSTELVTRLTMFGANNEITDEPINIAGINGGKTYLEDYSFFINQGYTLEEIKSKPELFLRELMETDTSIDNVNDLKVAMEERLKVISHPQINASFTILNYSNLKGFKTEEPKLKERVWVYDPELELELEAIIVATSKNSDNPLDINVEVSDVIVYNNRFADSFNNNSIVDKIIDDKGKIHGMYIKEATIDTLHCKDAFITSAKIGTAQIDTAHIKQGAIGSAAISDAAIGNAHISDLNADKIKAGTISTANVKVASASGEIEITGYQVIVNDTSDLANKYNRVILGKYKNNTEDETEPFKYGLVVRGKNGQTTMIDENGVHNAGITDGAIDDNKISDDANIQGGKIDLSSLIHEINTQEGLEKISGMTIQIDNKSLEVIFKEIESIVNEHETSINSHNTEIEQTKNDIRLLYESISQIQSGELVGTIITSTNGNIFNGENKETSLVLQAFNGTKEITDTIDDTRVIWTRNSGNIQLDESWNNNKTGKIIKLTAEDILNRSTFSSKLLSKKVDGQEQGAISISQITLLDYSDTLVGDVAPINPSINLLWIDTSMTPNQMKRWNGSKWETINDTSELENELGNISNEIYAPEGGLLSAMEWVKNEIKINQDGIALKADKTEINSLYNRKYKAKYIREYINGNSVNNANHWVEFKAFAKGLNILQNKIPTIISGSNPQNLEYMTDNIHTDKTKFATISGSNVCIEFDLGEVREDVEFIHIWHYFADKRSYRNNKIQISEDKKKWITLQDNTENPYVESEQGNIIPVSLGNVVENYGSRIISAEISLTPESISQTVRNSMANDFAGSSNLLDKSAKFVKDKWISSSFIFDDAKQNASLNLKTNSVGELNTKLEYPVKLEINSYHCMSIQFLQKSELFNHKVDFEIIIKGDNVNKTHRINNVSIDTIKQPKTLYLQYLSSDKIEILKEVSIKVYRKEEVATDTFIVLECPQFEKGTFPSKWTYPYELAQHDEYSYREQTASKISEKVGSGDFESYKEQTDKLISQKITASDSRDIAKEETKKIQDNLDQESKELNDLINNTNEYMTGAFKDGVIDEAEKATLREHLKQIEKEKLDVDKQYDLIYNNSNLTNVATRFSSVLRTDDIVEVENIELNTYNLEMNINKYYDLTPIVTPSDATNKRVIWSSSNKNIVDISYGTNILKTKDGKTILSLNNEKLKSTDMRGVLFAKNVGKCIITATTQDGSKVATCSIEVKNILPVISNISISNTNKNGSYTLTYDAVDLDNDVLTHKLKIANGDFIPIIPSKNGNKYTYNGIGLSYGYHIAQIEVFDSKDRVSSSAFIISIPTDSVNESGGVKDVLYNCKNDFNLKFNALKRIIGEIIGKITINTIDTGVYENTIGEYRESFARLQKYLTKSIDEIGSKKVANLESDVGNKMSLIEQKADSITQTVKTDYSTTKETTDKIDKVIKDYKVTVDREFADINSAHNSLENTMNGAFKDGVVSEAEAKAINERLVSLEKEKVDVDKEYNAVYSNSSLNNTTEKTNLLSSKNAYNTAYTNLKNVITTGIADGKVTPNEVTNINTKTNEYKVSSANYKEAFVKAVDKIGSVKSSLAETNSKNYTNSEIKQTSDTIIQKVEKVETDVKSNQDRITSAEQKITPDAITGSVMSNDKFKQNYSTTVQTAEMIQTSVKGKVDGNELESAIAQSSEKITQTITALDEKIGDKISIIEQKADSITNRVSNTEQITTTLTSNINKAQTDANAANNQATINKTEITKTNSKVASVETNLNGITSRVSNVEDTTGTLNGKVTAHESRIASAEQKITPSAIINTVSQTIDNKVNVVDKKLGEMKLENDALNIKFEQRGGVNYLRCADGFKNNITADWHTRTFNNNLGAVLSIINNNEWAYPDPNVATFQLSVLDNWSISSGEIATIQYDIKVQKGKEYTISFYTAGHRHSDCYSQIRGQENNGNAVIAAIGFSPQRGGSNLNNWSFVKYSFVAQTNFVHFEIGMRNRGDADPYLWFSKPVLNDGALPIKFTTNDKELNSGITKINGDGVRCDFEDGSYASMGRNGLRYYKNGMSNPYQYITFNSRIAAIRNGHWRNVRLPDAFRGKQINNDFQLFVTLGNYNLNAYVSGSINGALRVAFAEWSGWDANNCTINIRPCFQKIGLDTKKLYGWDAGSTSEGAVANEGEGDVIIFAQM